jgi:hypothetical protein
MSPFCHFVWLTGLWWRYSNSSPHGKCVHTSLRAVSLLSVYFKLAGYVNKLLSASLLYPFSRVTYCAYLVHPIMIRIMAMRMDSPMHLSLEVMVSIELFHFLSLCHHLCYWWERWFTSNCDTVNAWRTHIHMYEIKRLGVVKIKCAFLGCNLV